MAKITKIKASDPREKAEKPKDKKSQKASTQTPSTAVVKNTIEPQKIDKKEAKLAKKQAKKDKKPFFLVRPFLALGRYFRDSWRELRLVRWPSRKSTWGMVLAVFIYTAIIVAVVMLLDMLFSYLSNLLFA